MNKHLWIPLLAVMAAAGCSKSPRTFGDELSSRGDKAAEIGAQWNKSNESVAEGQEQVKKGQAKLDEAVKDQAEARKIMDEGLRQVQEGRQQMLNAENRYQNMRASAMPSPGSSPAPQQPAAGVLPAPSSGPATGQ